MPPRIVPRRVETRARQFLVGVVLGLVLATALRALLSTLFYLSLATLRLNPSAATVLVLLAPALAFALPRSRWPLVVAGLATAALPFARFTNAFVPVAALASGAGALALAQLPRVGLAGALVGLAINGVSLVLGTSHDPWVAIPALAPLLAGLTLSAARLHPRNGDAAEAETGAAAFSSTRFSAGVAWAAFLAAEVAFLASPYAVARHVPTGAPLAAAVGVLGLVLGVSLGTGAAFRWLLGLGVLGLVDLAVLRSPVAPLSLGLVQAALGASALQLPRPSGLAFGGAFAGLLFFLLFYGQVVGAGEWLVVLPLLALVPLGLALASADAPALAPPRAALPLALAGLLVVPAALPVAPPPPDEEGALRVVNWNLHQGFGNRGALDPEIYADVLRGVGPDVVVLQEADTARLSSGGLDVVHYLARELRLHPIQWGSGLGMLSRYPIAEGVPAPPAEGWQMEVPLDVRGEVVWVHGVHLARSSQERARQVTEILEAAEARPGPRILAGDLNSCPTPTCFGGRPSDDVHARLTEEFEDAWSAHHAPDDPAGSTHPARDPRRRIDVVMVQGLEVVSAQPLRSEGTRLASDHLPVVAELRLRGQGEA